jgi:hypothetical protein
MSGRESFKSEPGITRGLTATPPRPLDVPPSPVRLDIDDGDVPPAVVALAGVFVCAVGVILLALSLAPFVGCVLAPPGAAALSLGGGLTWFGVRDWWRERRRGP